MLTVAVVAPPSTDEASDVAPPATTVKSALSSRETKILAIMPVPFVVTDAVSRQLEPVVESIAAPFGSKNVKEKPFRSVKASSLSLISSS